MPLTVHKFLDYCFFTIMILSIAGRHSADNIRSNVEEVLADYELTDKVRYIISDNASNMVKAFSVRFLTDEHMVDEEDIWVRAHHISKNIYLR